MKHVTLRMTRKQAQLLLVLIDSYEEANTQMGAEGYKDVDKVAALITSKVQAELERLARADRISAQLKRVREHLRTGK